VEKHPSYRVPRLEKALAEQEGIVVNPKLLRMWGLSQSRPPHPDHHLFPGAGDRYDAASL